MDVSQIGEHYLLAHTRVDELVRTLSESELARPADACPGWSVADVVAHCAGIVEDALAGRLSGPPNEEQTAVQVNRHRGRPIAEVLGVWAEGVESFAEVIAAAGIGPALIDILSHEQDIRTALGRPGFRDEPGVTLAAQLAIVGLDVLPDVIEVAFPDGTTVRSAQDPAGPQESVIQLRTTPYEVMRFRLGRRTPAEVADLDWSTDPSSLIERMFVFGRREQSLGE